MTPDILVALVLIGAFAPWIARDVERNLTYARECMSDSLKRGEAPFVPHLLFPQVLNDTDGAQRHIGIKAALAYLVVSPKLVVYQDLGVSSGMSEEIKIADVIGIPIEYRRVR